MKYRLVLACLVIIVLTGTGRALAQGEQADRIRDAVSTFDEIMKAPDHAIPEAILKKAAAIVVFPGTIKGGFVLGAERGHGIVSARTSQGGWTSPAFLSLTGGSFGAQIGLTAVDVVLVIMNEHGLRNLIGNEFKIGANAAVAAGPVGRDAQAATDIQMRAEILSYSRSRGLFAGVTLNGSSVHEDDTSDERFYGKRLTTRDIVIDGKAGAPEPVASWIAVLKKYCD